MSQEIIFQKAKSEDWADIAALLQQVNLPLVEAETHLAGFVLARRGGAPGRLRRIRTL